MNYQKTLDWMFGQLPMYQRQGKTAFKKDLTNTVILAHHLGNPHHHFKSIHVAGTNGKGSTSSMIASILQEAGYRVGLYTSPHLKDFRERIQINGKPASKQFVIQFIKRNRAFFEAHSLSFFEMTVGMAFDYFAKKKVDIAVIEVGLGGRLDSTNIITPEVSVITNIGLDHTQFLGETLPEIATEKAGIIKEGIPVVIGEFHDETFPVFESIAKERNAPLHLVDSASVTYKTDLLGLYQQLNAKTAVAAVSQLKGFIINGTHISKGLQKVVKNTGLLGRWQVLQETPKVICDTAHNREGLTLVMEQLGKETYRALHIVLGVVKDKTLATVLPLFPAVAQYYFCAPDIPRALPVTALQKQAIEFGLKGKVYSSVSEAYTTALRNAADADVVFVGGSTFVVAEVV